MASNDTNSSLLLSWHYNNYGGNSTSTDDSLNTGTIVVLSFMGFFAVIIMSFIIYAKIMECRGYRQYLNEQNKVVP